jgi:hypothetical protein
MPETVKKRARLTGVTLNVEYPNGSTGVITIDPTYTTGLFWSDETVLEIFAPYYDSVETPSEMTKKEFLERFGTHAKKIIGKNDKIVITKNVVEELWKLQDEKGFLRAVLGKTTECTPR